VYHWNSTGIQIAIILAAFCTGLVACAKIPENLIGVENPGVPATEVQDASLHSLLIATNRKVSDDPAVFFGGQRGDSLEFAKVLVSVPPIHTKGRIEYPKQLPPDPNSNFVITNPRNFTGSSGFVSEVNRELDKREPGDRSVLIFVHGYNTHLSSAILSATQFVHDSGYKGVPVLFSWPSKGRSFSYIYDFNSTLVSRRSLLSTFEALERTNATGIDIVAHSLGNFLVLEAAVQAQLQEGKINRNRIRTIILASPDVDLDVFKRQAEYIQRGPTKIYVLVSEDDKALAISRRIAGGVNRIGASSIEELEEFDVTVVDLTEVQNRNSSSHSKFREAPDIVRLIGKRLNEGDSLNANDQNYSLPLLGQLIDHGGRIGSY
jgi:esterase/lipase superfamily enzyme